MPPEAGEVPGRLVPVLPARAERLGVPQAGRVPGVSRGAQCGAQSAKGEEAAAPEWGAGRATTAGVGALTPAHADRARDVRCLSRPGEGPVESRVRENLTHGSEGGRWKHDLSN